MLALTEAEQTALTALGARLRRRRLLAEEPQFRAAVRIGFSVPTYRNWSRVILARKLVPGCAPFGSMARLKRSTGSSILESLFDSDLSRQRAPRCQ
ncbi:hypothetical protein Thiowin_01407 [Thiorhodovibrio winogradskyi]|uniref:Uncharacterized protein n=1 Tax=Thiorhodovibrio winogradskyi TaxID=77007 RepID=A0ABZ0S851_9GAMM|nr:hypothetical protein [Thiorhodovibrio winogradskyi]